MHDDVLGLVDGDMASVDLVLEGVGGSREGFLNNSSPTDSIGKVVEISHQAHRS